MLFRSNDTATTEIYTSVNTLSLHDPLPISGDHQLTPAEGIGPKGVGLDHEFGRDVRRASGDERQSGPINRTAEGSGARDTYLVASREECTGQRNERVEMAVGGRRGDQHAHR